METSSLNTKMKLKIFVQDEGDHLATSTVLREAIRGYFAYESRLARSNFRERMKVSRWFLLVGLLSLFACLGLSEFLTSLESDSKLLRIAGEGLVIIGWVAMWRPVEGILYDWWPLREQRLRLEKIANMKIDVECGR